MLQLPAPVQCITLCTVLPDAPRSVHVSTRGTGEAGAAAAATPKPLGGGEGKLFCGHDGSSRFIALHCQCNDPGVKKQCTSWNFLVGVLPYRFQSFFFPKENISSKAPHFILPPFVKGKMQRSFIQAEVLLC